MRGRRRGSRGRARGATDDVRHGVRVATCTFIDVAASCAQRSCSPCDGEGNSTPERLPRLRGVTRTRRWRVFVLSRIVLFITLLRGDVPIDVVVTSTYRDPRANRGYGWFWVVNFEGWHNMLRRFVVFFSNWF